MDDTTKHRQLIKKETNFILNSCDTMRSENNINDNNNKQVELSDFDNGYKFKQRSSTFISRNSTLETTMDSADSKRMFSNEKKELNRVINNYFKLNIIFHIIIVICCILVSMLKLKLFYSSNTRVKEDYSKLRFGLISFTYDEKRYPYGCLNECPQFKCEGLTEKDIDRIIVDHDFSCGEFSLMKWLGIGFLILINIGNVLSLISMVVAIGLLFEKISCDRAEKIFFFSRLETIIYFISFLLFYSLAVGLTNSALTKWNFLYLAIMVVSIINYYLFRYSFYKKMRINSMI